MKRTRRSIISVCLILTVFLALFSLGVQAADSGTVDTVLFYVKNSDGEDILVSHISVSEMIGDIAHGAVSNENHNYSTLDRYVTTVHQEGQGFTLPQFVAYAQEKSDSAAMKTLALSFDGDDRMSFWERDQQGFDDMDTYTYSQLYGVQRYNFPELYRYWNYTTQDFDGEAGRSHAIEKICESKEPEEVIIAVISFSQRFIFTKDKFDAQDYYMEDYWQEKGLLDSQRSLRLMIPVTEEQLRSKNTRLSDGRFWIANILLDMYKRPDIKPETEVAAPEAIMTEDGENYYIRFSCTTPGAVILYNHSWKNKDYTPTCEYTGTAVVIPKADFPDGTVNISCRAVKDGCTDAGVAALSLKAAGKEKTIAFKDVPEDAWYRSYVVELASQGIINGMSSELFQPDGTVTWGQALKLVMLAAGYGEQTAKNGHWAQGYLDMAAAEGITDYTGSLDSPISRLEFCRAAAKALKLTAGLEDSPFDDTDDPCVLALYEKGVINGMGGGRFGVNELLTRAQISKIIWSIRQG